MRSENSVWARRAGHVIPRGMTLVETLIAAFVLALLLLVVAEGTEYVRNRLKTTRTWETLARLDEAVTAYHEATGQWPDPEMRNAECETRRGGEERGKESDRTAHRQAEAISGRQGDGQRATGQVLEALRAVPASRDILAKITGQSQEAPADPAIRDAWGRPVRCLTPHSESPIDRQAVAAQGGRPIFLSLGPGNGETGLRTDERPR